MRYLGSKTSLLKNIYSIISRYKISGSFCDPFGGIGTVGSYMKGKGYSVYSGDLLKFAHCFQIARIQNDSLPDFFKLKQLLSINTIQELEGYMSNLFADRGWFVKEYSIERRFFTISNASIIQACIDKIWNWQKLNIINENEYSILIASLINSMDRVANTAGTYYAYLKTWYRKALNRFEFKMLEPINGKQKCHSFLMDAISMVNTVTSDILYLDPPYNERSYGSYYHLPETIARGIIPKPRGKSGVYSFPDTKSNFNNRTKALNELEQIVNDSNSECIIFHYTDNGLIPYDNILDVLSHKGSVEEYFFDSKGYCTNTYTPKTQHHIYRVLR